MKKIIIMILLFLSIASIAISEDCAIKLSDKLLKNLATSDFNDFCNYLTNESDDSFIQFSSAENSFCIEKIKMLDTEYSSVECINYSNSLQLRLHYTCEFGETIDNSETYVSTVNSFVSKYGDPDKTDYDLHMQLLYGRSISWILEEYGIHATILYHDGNAAQNEFPEIEIILYEFNNN